MNTLKILPNVVVLLFVIASCSQSSPTDTTTDSTSNTVQGAMSAASSSASSSEGGSVGLIQNEINDIDNIANYIDPSDAINPFSSACTMSTASSCSGSTATISWNGCTIAGGKGTLTGGWTEVFSSGSCVRPLGNGITMTRTSAGETITSQGGDYRTTDTSGGTAWDGTVLPSTGDVISNTSGTRTIVIHGRHEISVNHKGKTIYDHFLSSPGLSVTGSRLNSNRVINGSLTHYHNLLKYNANHTFNNVTYSDATCCYPTSGSISTTLSGSKKGSLSLTFSSTCGSAVFNENGADMALTLDHCI